MAFAAALVVYIALAVMGVWDFSYVAVFMAVLLAVVSRVLRKLVCRPWHE